jgi:hypothetical protein
MTSTPNNPQQGADNSEQSIPDRVGSGRVVRISGALAACAIVVTALFVLVSSGIGSAADTTTAAEPAATVTVAVTTPASESVIAADQVTVRGTVSPTTATVQVQGQPAAVGNGVFTGTATLHGGKTTVDVIGSAPGATPGSTSIVIARQSTANTPGTTRPVSPATTPAIPSVGSYSAETNCGGELAVGPNTTCPFAENVRAAYENSGPGIVTAYSPATNRSYAMTCSNGPSVVCAGGNDASVYFPGQSAGDAYETQRQGNGDPTPAVASAGSYSRETACGEELAVGPNTTCAFAESVRSAYQSSGSGTVIAYSPVTHKTYAMTCSGGSPVICTGGNDATVYIP